MNKKFLLLAASLAGNLGLFALLLSSGGSADPALSTPTSTSTPAGSAAKVAHRDVDPALWANLGGDDVTVLAARLTNAGFPPTLARAILSAQLNETYAARRKALNVQRFDGAFWKLDRPNDAKTLAALRELSREHSKALRELGVTAAQIDDPQYAASMRRQYGNLSFEKIEQINRVQQDYNDLRNDIYTAAGLGGGGSITLLPEEQARITLLQKEQREDIARLLTPEELEDYDLRSSNTASQMRYSLAAFNPNEQEFRAIYKLQSQFDERFNTQNIIALPPQAQQEFMQQRTEAQKQLTAEIAAALGGQRGVEYEQAADNNFQQIYRVVERLELPRDAAVQVWTAQKDIEQRLTAIRNDRTLTAPARTEQFVALAQEANSRVMSAIGDRGYEVYKQYGGFWIQNLEQQAAAPVRPGAGAGAGAGAAGGRGGAVAVPDVLFKRL